MEGGTDLSENFENDCFRQIIPYYLQTQLNGETFIKLVFLLTDKKFCLTGELHEFCAKNVKIICVKHPQAFEGVFGCSDLIRIRKK
jgi:hypothetical protein